MINTTYILSPKTSALDMSGSSQTTISPISHEEQELDEELPEDVFGKEDNHDIKYKTLSWPLVSGLMITEIVSTGLLTLPNSLAIVGVVPGVLVIAFLGAFTTYTAWSLIQFKLHHPRGE